VPNDPSVAFQPPRSPPGALRSLRDAVRELLAPGRARNLSARPTADFHFVK
jgi:hypothetical protein